MWEKSCDHADCHVTSHVTCQLGHVTFQAWSRDHSTTGHVTKPLAIEYLACDFFMIKLKVEGNLKCGYNAQYHFQCKVAINLGSFESFILLCS